MLAKMKLTHYSSESLKVSYLLLLALFPYNVKVVTDLRAVKAAQLASYVARPSDCGQTSGLPTMPMHKPPASQLSQLQSLLTGDSPQTQRELHNDYIKDEATLPPIVQT